jgi:hypothetical protein
MYLIKAFPMAIISQAHPIWPEGPFKQNFSQFAYFILFLLLKESDKNKTFVLAFFTIFYPLF